MEQRTTWVLAALGAIATLGAMALTTAYEVQAEQAATAVTVGHLGEDIAEIKEDLDTVVDTVHAIDKRLFYLCRANAHECPP